MMKLCESQGRTVEEVFTKLKECMKGENSSFVRFLLLTLVTQTTLTLSTQVYVHAEHGIRTLWSDEILCDSKENEDRSKSCGGQEGQGEKKSKTSCVNFSASWVVDQRWIIDSVQEYMEASGVP